MSCDKRSSFIEQNPNLLLSSLIPPRPPKWHKDGVLSKEPPCANLLSNTAQVLTSLAQAIDNTNDPLPLLEEAIELFQRCLTLQEYYHTEYLDRLDNSDPTKNPAENTPVHADTPPSREASLEAERWATIVEPVTVDTLLDTILAQLETLTTLASMIPADSTKGLVWIEEYFAKQLEPKIQSYM